MWIDTPEKLVEIKHPDMDEAVDVSGENATQVTAEVGELLTERFDPITEHTED